jgi:antitoxin component YwqK of YwqJK toxin-antitoxin module
MPNTNDRSYQNLYGFYTDDVKLFKHTLCNGKLISTKIYHENGNVLHELNLEDGLVTSAKNFNNEGQIL